MRLAVYTAVYPQALAFIPDFVASLAQQSDTNFDLYVSNDGLSDTYNLFSTLVERLRIIPAHGSISHIRKAGIQRMAADGIEGVIFADCDDRMSDDRVAISRQLLTTHEVVVNELIPFGKNIHSSMGLLRPLLKNNHNLTWHDILDHNVLGLGNTAARISAIAPHVAAINECLLAFDWALYARALYRGASCIFTTKTATYYRQHSDNIARIDKPDAQAVLRAALVKAAHYTDLATLDAEFAKRADYFTQLTQVIEKDPHQLATYTQARQQHPQPAGLWWNAAPLPKELSAAQEPSHETL